MADAFAMYQQVLSRLSGGGDTLKADLADIEAGKKGAIATGTQNLISGGLGGTTVMGAVPLAAEKTAGRARLRARGGAEEKYLSVLTSFANLAESSKQQELNRKANAGGPTTVTGSVGNMSISGQGGGGTTIGGSYGFGADASNRPGWGMGTYGSLGGSGGTAQQFPSLYGSTGGTTASPVQTSPDIGGRGGDPGWTPPREYDPSMVGKSMWGQQGSQAPTTLEQGTQQQVTAGLPQSAQAPKQSEEERITASFIATGKWKMGPNGQLMRA